MSHKRLWSVRSSLIRQSIGLALLILCLPILVFAQTDPTDPPLSPTPFPTFRATDNPLPSLTPVFVPTATAFPTSTPEADTALMLTIGETKQGELPYGIQEIRYHFSAEAGQLLLIQYIADREGQPLVAALTSVTDQAGYPYVTPRYTSAEKISLPFVAPYTGVYEVVIQRIQAVEQPGYFRLRVFEPEVQAVDFSESMQGIIDDENPIHVYEFTAQAAEFISIISEQQLEAVLYHQDELGIFTQMLQFYATVYNAPYQISQTGTYYLLLPLNSQGDSFDYTLDMRRVTIQRLSIGETVTGEISAAESSQYYQLDAVFGDILDLTVTEASLDTLLSLYLLGNADRIAYDDDGGLGYNPEQLGVLINQSSLPYLVRVQAFTEGETGTFTLQVIPSPNRSLDRDDGAQVFRLDKWRVYYLNFSAEAGERVRVTLRNLDSDAGLPNFSVSQNEQLLVNMSASTSPLPELSTEFLVPEDGRLLISVGDQSNAFVPIDRFRVHIERIIDE